MKKNFINLILLAVIFAGSLLFFSEVLAVDLNSQVTGQLNAGVASAGLSPAQDPRIIAASIVNFFLGLMGAVFLILIAMASYWYITARGESAKVEKAGTTIRRAIIGLIIVMMAYSITYFVSKNVQSSTQGAQSLNKDVCLGNVCL